ncbi:hypothetical protein SeLEV6574_g04778 [Synchytrium endobioticum]|uniref:Chromo domain-containing protein n=1 Tax=Synchytrium endobioticum TaxID=286115 RepID=A0A507CXR3_9FUNG|nr:hypothetical protein SeLEV6574_g04778 [Synchytrium endobioticum]
MEEVQKRLQECIESAQQHYKKYADEKRRDEVELSVGDEVLINTINMKTTRPSRKFEQRATGPYYIKKQISPVSFQVQLPPNLKIHDVFHIKLLQKYIRPNDPSRALPKPPPIPFEEQEGWEIEDIIDVKRKRNKFEYLVHWKGFPPSDRSWEPQSSLNDDELLREWHNRHPEKISPFTSSTTSNTPASIPTTRRSNRQNLEASFGSGTVGSSGK